MNKNNLFFVNQGGNNLTYGLQGETRRLNPKTFGLSEEEMGGLQPSHTDLIQF